MPHQCTNCGRAFPDGSKEMLSGCPTCGSNKFQFRPEGTVEERAELAADADSGDAEPGRGGTEPGHHEADTDHDEAGPGSDRAGSGRDDAPPASAGASPGTGEEDGAQAAARSEVVDGSELPDAGTAGGAAGDSPASHASTADQPAGSESGDADPDIAALREKLNDQFESIRILNPGQYELNLMELYDRDEYIISLREDGRYVIEMPETWGPDE